jgi:hypothetical protein
MPGARAWAAPKGAFFVPVQVAQQGAGDETVEFAPFKLDLEEECPLGFNCPHSRSPMECKKNHHMLGEIIEQGRKLPRMFCKWDRPWEKVNGYPKRCRNPTCFFAHLRGRKDYLTKIQSKAAEVAANDQE